MFRTEVVPAGLYVRTRPKTERPLIRVNAIGADLRLVRLMQPIDCCALVSSTFGATAMISNGNFSHMLAGKCRERVSELADLNWNEQHAHREHLRCRQAIKGGD